MVKSSDHLAARMSHKGKCFCPLEQAQTHNPADFHNYSAVWTINSVCITSMLWKENNVMQCNSGPCIMRLLSQESALSPGCLMASLLSEPSSLKRRSFCCYSTRIGVIRNWQAGSQNMQRHTRRWRQSGERHATPSPAPRHICEANNKKIAHTTQITIPSPWQQSH